MAKTYTVAGNIKQRNFIKDVPTQHLVILGVIFGLTFFFTYAFGDNYYILGSGIVLCIIYYGLVRINIFNSLPFHKLRIFAKRNKNINPLVVAIGSIHLSNIDKQITNNEGGNSSVYLIDSNNSKVKEYKVVYKISGLSTGLVSDSAMDYMGDLVSKMLNSYVINKCQFITQVYPAGHINWNANDEYADHIKSYIQGNINSYDMYLVLTIPRNVLYKDARVSGLSVRDVDKLIDSTITTYMHDFDTVGISYTRFSTVDYNNIYKNMLGVSSPYKVSEYKNYTQINNNYYMAGSIPNSKYPIYPVHLRYLSEVVPGVEQGCVKTIISTLELLNKKESKNKLKYQLVHDQATINRLYKNNIVSTGEEELMASYSNILSNDLLDPFNTGVNVAVDFVISAESEQLLYLQQDLLNKQCDSVNIPSIKWALYNNTEYLARNFPLFHDIKKIKRNDFLHSRGFYSLKFNSHFTSTAQVPALLPIYLNSKSLNDGTPCGRDVYSGEVVCVDPHVMYRKEVINSPNVLVMGDIGSGKSSLIKSVYVLRSFLSGKSIVVFDRKYQYEQGEYYKVAQMCNTNVLHFGGDNATCINILDINIPVRSNEGICQLDMLYLVCEYAHGSLSSYEQFCVEIAHVIAIRQAKEAGNIATIHDIIRILLTFDESCILDEYKDIFKTVNVLDVRNWCLSLALDLRKYVSGTLKGMVDGVTSEYVDFVNNQLTIIDTSKLIEGSTQLSLVTLLITTLLSSIWARQQGDKVLVLEEGYHLLGLKSSENIAHILRSLVKRGRGIGLSVVTVVHHISDIHYDNPLYSLLKEVDIIHIYRQSKKEDIEHVINMYDLPDISEGVVSSLQRGEHILHVSNYTTRVVEHMRVPDEVELTNTNF